MAGVRTMKPQPRRWRLRLSTLMLLVVIAGLVSYIVGDKWNTQQEMKRLMAERDRALMEFERAQLLEEQLRQAEEQVGKDEAAERLR